MPEVKRDYKQGDRVVFTPDPALSGTLFNNKPLYGTVIDPRPSRWGGGITEIQWDVDVHPDHGRRPDMPWELFAPVNNQPAVNENAVRGADNLTPGLYRIHNLNRTGPDYFIVTTGEVTKHTVGLREVKTMKALGLDGRARTIYLGDIGVEPRRMSKGEFCNLGHYHDPAPVYSPTAWTERVDSLD